MPKTDPITVNVTFPRITFDPQAIKAIQASADRARQEQGQRRAEEARRQLSETPAPKFDPEALGVALARGADGMRRMARAFQEETARLAVGAPFPTPHMDSFLKDASEAKAPKCSDAACPGHPEAVPAKAPWAPSAPVLGLKGERDLELILPDGGEREVTILSPIGKDLTTLWPRAVVRLRDGRAIFVMQEEVRDARARDEAAEARVKELQAQVDNAAMDERNRLRKWVRHTSDCVVPNYADEEHRDCNCGLREAWKV